MGPTARGSVHHEWSDALVYPPKLRLGRDPIGRYGLEADPESIPRLCEEYGLLHPMLEAGPG